MYINSHDQEDFKGTGFNNKCSGNRLNSGYTHIHDANMNENGQRLRENTGTKYMELNE